LSTDIFLIFIEAKGSKSTTGKRFGIVSSHLIESQILLDCFSAMAGSFNSNEIYEKMSFKSCKERGE